MPTEPHSNESLFYTPFQPEEKPDDLGFIGSLAPAFRTENEVYGAVRTAQAPRFKYDSTFDLPKALQGNPLAQNYADAFVGVGSKEEFDYRTRVVQSEIEDRKMLSSAGVPGMIAAMLAGSLSPTMLIPLTGPARGAKGVAQAFALAFGASAAQEFVLQQEQYTRSGEETAFGIAGGTVLAGLLGSAGALLGKSEFADIAKGIDISRGELSVYPLTPVGSSAAGAQITAAPGAGRLKWAPLVDQIAKIGPVTRIINDENPTASWFMAQLSSAGAFLDRNIAGIATSRGGTIEARIKTHAEGLARSLNTLEDSFDQYWSGTTGRLAGQTRARVSSFLFPQEGKLNFDEFKREVARAMFSSDKHDVPEVQQAAEAFRKELYDPLLEEARSVGIIPEEVDLKGAESYLNRIYDINNIVGNPEVFLRKLSTHIEEKLQGAAEKRLTKIKERTARAISTAEDLTRSREEVAKLREQVKQELERIKEDPLAALADELSEARRAERTAKQGAREARAQQAAASRETGLPGDRTVPQPPERSTKQILEEGGKPLAEFLTNKTKLKQRMKALNRSVVGLEAKQRRAFEKIDQIEEQNLSALRRIGTAALKLQKNLDKLSDEKLNLELSRLRDQFYALDAVMQKADERLRKLDETLGGIDTREQRITRNQREQIISKTLADFTPEAKFDESTIIGEIALEAEQGAKNLDEWVANAERIARESGLGDEAVSEITKEIRKTPKAAPQVRAAVRAGVEDAAAGRKSNPPNGPKAAQAYETAYHNWSGQRAQLDAERSAALSQANTLNERGLAAEVQQERRGVRLSDIAERLDEAQQFDREAAREAVAEANQAVLEKVNQVNTKRVLRSEKLRKRAEKLDPERAVKEAETLREKAKTEQERFIDSIRTKADEFDVEKGTFDFKTHARDIATEIRDKIVGMDRRIAGLDILVGERGPELARMLDIDEKEFEDFLIYDIEHLARAYERTMAADVEMARKFESPNAVEAWRQLRDSFHAEEERLRERLETQGFEPGRIAKIRGAVDKKWQAEQAAMKQAEGEFNATVTDKAVEAGFKSLTPAERKANEKIMDAYRALWKRQRAIENDLGVVIDRLRHRRGIPENADGMMYRMGKAALALNTLRLMGSVVVASAADPARIVMKYGLVNTFRDGFVPMVTNFKRFKMVAAEAKAAGVALDTILASRAATMFDIFDDIGRGNKGERGLQFLANNFGNIAGFNQWTSAMKQFSAGVIHAQLYKALRTILVEEAPSAKKLDRAREMLASLGIDGTNAGKVWEQLTTHGGGDEVGGITWPNTAAWTDAEARRTYRAALAQAVDDTIITPGAERPNWVDHNIGLRLIAQFRSFNLSSTTKTMMAGLQQRDMAVVNGMASMLALGALSYYLYAIAAGGKAYEEMMKAGPDRWADEAIDRSGLLAVLTEFRNIAERVPATADLVTFSGQRTSRRQGTDLIDAVFGASASGIRTGASVLQGIDDPTQSTVHGFRQLLPFQNVFYIRRLLDAVEHGVTSGINLPEKRS